MSIPSDMKFVTLNELNFLELNWLLTRLELRRKRPEAHRPSSIYVFDDREWFDFLNKPDRMWDIANREGITNGMWDTSPYMAHYGPEREIGLNNPRIVGPSRAIAVGRAYVYRQLGSGPYQVPMYLVEPESNSL